ncbi:MAG: hypothetical protein HQK58_08145 [Deltaproteobacteria bacterium]|nr:hypothetical protein [Deltaproteobacteria bacterium]
MLKMKQPVTLIFLPLMTMMFLMIFTAQGIAGPPRLPAPAVLRPTNGAIFNHFPRKTVMNWTAVPGAVAYRILVEYKGGAWIQLVKHEVGATVTSYEFQFIGAQPGRCKVWAVDARNHNGIASPWHNFRYTR